MISNIQLINSSEIIDFFMNKNESLIKDFESKYNKKAMETIVLQIIQYLELQVNCSLIESQITLDVNKDKVVLPFWPIRKIVSVKNDSNYDVPYKLLGNKLEILLDDGNVNYTVQYLVGYPAEIVAHMSLNLIVEKMIIDYISEEVFVNNPVLLGIFHKISNLYGKED